MKIFDNHNHLNDEKQEEIPWSLDQCSVDGLNLEFGVFKGYSINMLASHAPDKTFYGFDSFQGLPENWKFGPKKIKKGHFALSKLPNVEKNVVLIKGWFNEVLEDFIQEHPGDLSFLHLDCDLKSSVTYVLNTLNNRIVEGTIIRCDEYKDWEGKRSKRKIPQGRFTNWKTEGEYPAMEAWKLKYGREVEMIGRNWHCSAIFKVIK